MLGRIFLAPRDWSVWNGAGTEWETMPYGPTIDELCDQQFNPLTGESCLDSIGDNDEEVRVGDTFLLKVRKYDASARARSRSSLTS